MPLDFETENFGNGFLGYGDAQGQWWFIGMEEGGGNTCPEVCARIKYWIDHGRRPLLDLADFCRKMGNGLERWFPQNGNLPPLQPTWHCLMIIQLMARDIEGYENADSERRKLIAKKHQLHHWGRYGSDTCLIEVLPFPSPGNDKFYYMTACWENIVPLFAKNRDEAFKHFNEKRGKVLNELWEANSSKNKKRVVVYYAGLTNKPNKSKKFRNQELYWEWFIQAINMHKDLPIPHQLNGGAFNARIYAHENTILVRTHHPSQHGIPDDYWIGIGIEIRKWLA